MSYVPGSPSEAIQQPQAHVGEDVLGRRVSAALIDLGLLTVIFIVLGMTIGESRMEDGTASVNLSGLPVLLFFVFVLLYYFAFEAAIGQTIGKLILGLRVVRVDGGRASVAAIATRTLLRIIDGLPFLYLVGFIMVMATGARRQRLGDLVAKTKVVRKGKLVTAQGG